MDAKLHQGIVASLRRQAVFFRVLTMVLGAAVAMQAVTVFALKDTTERIVIVPPEVNNEFWVEESQVSKRYFLEWGHYLAMLLLNVTPHSAAYQGDVLLRHVAPESREVFSQRLRSLAAHLNKEKLSTFFTTTDVMVEPGRQRVAFAGSLVSYVAGRRVGEKNIAYMATFRVHNGRLQLLEFVETKPTSLFEPL